MLPDAELGATLNETVNVNINTTTSTNRKPKPSAASVMSRVLLQAFTMTFLAEWGDRSQLTTIILAARENLFGVIVGGVLGHSICTGLAVIGGRMIAQRISVRTGESHSAPAPHNNQFTNSLLVFLFLSYHHRRRCVLAVRFQRLVHQPGRGEAHCGSIARGQRITSNIRTCTNHCIALIRATKYGFECCQYDFV